VARKLMKGSQRCEPFFFYTVIVVARFGNARIVSCMGRSNEVTLEAHSFLGAPTDASKVHVVLYGVIESLFCRYAEVLRAEFLGVLADIDQLAVCGIHYGYYREKDIRVIHWFSPVWQ